MWYGGGTMKLLILFVVVSTILAHGASAVSAQPDLREKKSSEAVNSKAASEQRLQRLKDDEAVQSQVDATKAQQAIRKQEQLQKRCETHEQVLTQYQSRFEKNAQGYSARFQNVHDKMTQLTERLSANADLDTTQLQANLATLQEMITDFAAKQPEFQAQLSTMQSAACSDGETEYRTAMQGAQNTFRSMRSEAEQIRLFIQNTIRPELVMLRQQLESSNGQ